jgi:hypothetical protein
MNSFVNAAQSHSRVPTARIDVRQMGVVCISPDIE